MKTVLKPLLILILFTISIFSLKAQDCNCKDAFEATVQAYEENYSLFIHKVTDDNRSLYNAHKDLIRNKAYKTSKISECKKVLDQYLHFFRDGHTYISYSDSNSSSSEKDFHFEQIKMSEKLFRKKFRKNNYSLNPILGIWKSGSYTAAITPSPVESRSERDYVGIIIDSSNPDWEQTDVKFELISSSGSFYQVNYMMGDHSVFKTTGEQPGKSVLEIAGLGNWHKIWPEQQQQQPEDELESKFNEFHLSYIDSIPYLRFPNFGSVGPSFVDSLMQSNHNRIMKSDFMIVDIRGNGGGSDYTYFPVLPYILSGPIEIPASGFWLSEYNIQMWMDYKTGVSNKKIEEYTKEEREEYEVLISNRGTAFFEHPEYSYTFNADTLYKGPKRIVILTDKKTASSGETLVFRAKQSDKVVVYGQNTAGVVDGFNGMGIDIGCFEVVFPSSFRARDIKENPIDPYGIAPDVFVNEDVDVLKYAIEHMRRLIEHEKGQSE